MDLSPFGINVTLGPETNVDSLGIKNILIARRNGSVLNIGNDYGIVQLLGRGIYGETYKGYDDNNGIFAVKIISSPSSLNLVIKECIINILLGKESEGRENGPYAPRFYKIGYNPITSEVYIVTELLTGTLHSFIKANGEQENDKMLIDALIQVSEILLFFGDRLQFNHRDLKPDNIMFLKNSYGAYEFKLIDFGLSCLNYNGLSIVATKFFKNKICYKKDRDMPQLLYAIISFYGSSISDNLFKTINRMLLAYSNGSKQYMKYLPTWLNSYNYLNRSNITVPTGEPVAVKRILQNYYRGKSFKASNNRTNQRLKRNNTQKLQRNLIQKENL